MAGGADQDPEDIISAINVTPLVDIMLVLLIIFMLTANIMVNPSIRVDLPEAATGEAPDPQTFAITIDADGQLYLDGEATTKEALRATIPQLKQEAPDVQAIIAADQRVEHGQVVGIIDLVRSAGVLKFAINIDPAVLN